MLSVRRRSRSRKMRVDRTVGLREPLMIMSQPRVYFEMPPIIGDINLPWPYKRAVELLSFKGGPGQLVIRVPRPYMRQFYEARYNGTRFPYAVLIIEIWNERKAHLAGRSIYQFLKVEVRSVSEYHGDVLVDLEFSAFEIVIPGLIPGTKGFSIRFDSRRGTIHDG